MSDRAARLAAVVLTALATLALLLDAPDPVKLPLVIGFAFIAPGLAATRFLPPLPVVDRLAFVAAISLSAVILVSLLLVAAGEWSGALTFAELVCLTTAFVAFPAPRDNLPSVESRRPQVPGQQFIPEIEVVSTTGGPDGGATTAAVSTRPLAEIHRRTRSADPAERRAGLHELADVLEIQGETAWAADLRSQAENPDV